MTKQAPKSWRDVLEIHRAADLFPLMEKTDPEALQKLGEDIKANGLRVRVVLWRDETGAKVLLDGRNRLDAMERIGKEVIGQTPDGAYEIMVPSHTLDHATDPWDYVVSANIHRRHLKPEQKDELIAKVLKATPTKSNRQVAKMVGVSHPHIAKKRKALEESGDVETVTTSIDTKGRKQPARKNRANPAASSPARPSSSKAVKKAEAQAASAAQDVGENSQGENARLRVRVEELKNEVQRLTKENFGLRSEVEELKEELNRRPRSAEAPATSDAATEEEPSKTKH